MKEYNSQERIAYLAYVLTAGGELDTAAGVQLTGASRRTIQRDFCRLERVLPVYRDGGRLKILDLDLDF